jgi:hypothetical protein
MDSASIYQIAVAEQQHNVPRAALFRALLRGLCELSIDKLSLGIDRTAHQVKVIY